MRWRRKNRWAAAALCLAAIAALLVGIYAFWVPKRNEDMIRMHAAEFGLEEELVFAVVRAESNFRADAVSPAGAVGLMQLMPSTARFMQAMLGASGEWREPQENIRLGAGYLRYLSDRFGRLEEVLAAYNAGEGTVRRWLSDPALVGADGELAHIPYPETRSYVRKTKNFYFCYKFFYG